TVDSITIVAATGNIDATSATTFQIAVDNTAPTYSWDLGEFSVDGGIATLGVSLSEPLASLAIDSASISVTSDAFDNVDNAFFSTSGTSGSVSFPVGATLPDTLSFSFTVDGIDVAGNSTDTGAVVDVTIIN
ncbi:MAG: hypothetical protein AAGC88_16730, partial [Bacteroidota bacterium]